MIVDDGGDATLMMLEGAKWEETYEKTKQLPDPATVNSEDEKELFGLLRKVIPEFPHRFRDFIKECHGVSEETTTGVHRLYKIEENGGLPFTAFNVINKSFFFFFSLLFVS